MQLKKVFFFQNTYTFFLQDHRFYFLYKNLNIYTVTVASIFALVIIRNKILIRFSSLILLRTFVIIPISFGFFI